jgi:hypothetical protein
MLSLSRILQEAHEYIQKIQEIIIDSVNINNLFIKILFIYTRCLDPSANT